MSKVLKEHSISSNSGDIDHDVLAEVLVSGLEVFEDGCELLSDDVSVKELSVPLVLVLSALELPDGELGKDTEDSLVVVSVTGCELAATCLVYAEFVPVAQLRVVLNVFHLKHIHHCHLNRRCYNLCLVAQFHPNHNHRFLP